MSDEPMLFGFDADAADDVTFAMAPKHDPNEVGWVAIRFHVMEEKAHDRWQRWESSAYCVPFIPMDALHHRVRVGRITRAQHERLVDELARGREITGIKGLTDERFSDGDVVDFYPVIDHAWRIIHVTGWFTTRDEAEHVGLHDPFRGLPA